ncbi:RxLR effector protein [Phytophthora megakarya]|uniref:RxLR effector protein n=1 Tax=Phytophthora megakarya TaxID=4795 RepID=A0A225WLX7_9STRA|nr:RxLR effector protein [Phytophthora megakarya]
MFLNLAIKEENWCGIPVLPPGQTVRYLGYDVGHADLPKINWVKGIRSIQCRMVTAEAAATSVRDRVDLLNAIVIPSVLFTVKIFPLIRATLIQLVNMQRWFLWRKQVVENPSRHKMSPDLIITPRDAGGLGLIAIPVAIQALRIKFSMQWLIGKSDRYYEAWKRWVGLEGQISTVSSRQPTHRT